MGNQQRSDQSAQLYALDEQSVQPHMLVLDDQECTIGRDPGCRVVVSRIDVSRIHARIFREGGRYMLADLDSSNGTYVNGRRISGSQQLQNDDQISVGTGSPVLHFVDPFDTIVPTYQLRFDERIGLFFYHGKALELTPNQVRLLRLLYRNSGMLCSRDQCARAVWNEPYDAAIHAGALDQLITTVRARLRQIDPSRDLIKTRRGMGYVLEL
jgi:hypothetical protein